MIPWDTHERLFGKLDGSIDMFVITGIMVVIGFTLVIVFNARLLTGLFTGASTGKAGYLIASLTALAAVGLAGAGYLAGDAGDGMGQLSYLLAGMLVPVAVLAWAAARFPQLAPALKMAVAYPLANRFRTGMTIAMFSLIVFSLTVFSVLLANYDAAFLGGDARGNLDVVATSSSPAPTGDVRQSLRDAGSLAVGDIEAVGRVTLPAGNQGVAIPGSADRTASPYPVLAADGEFLSSLEPGLASYATGYGSPAEVLAAVRGDPTLALVDATVVGVGDNDSFDWSAGVTVEDSRFSPFELEVVNSTTGASEVVTVIGALKVGLPSSTVAGVYLNEEAYRRLYGEPSYQRVYMRLADGADSQRVARDVQSALATQGLEADSVDALLDKAKAETTSFNRMFQAFMALGLLVGIAGLGVISFRSVVERRQQIGMLRAIGYQRGAVTTTFLLESAFVAVMGILSGVVGGALIGRNLLTSDAFSDGAELQFAMPWNEVILVVLASFAFSLLMTWWPSRGASRVPVAEALRYD
jgi:putative ABC transport system permease protein